MSLLYKKNRTDFEFTLDMFSTLRTVFFRNTCTIIMFALISLVMQVCCIHIFLFSHFPFCAQHRNEIILKLKWNEIVYALLVSLLSFSFQSFYVMQFKLRSHFYLVLQYENRNQRPPISF